MYPLALSVDVNRPGVIMTQTDVAQSFLMTPHQFLLHVVHADVALASSLVYLTDTKTTPRQRASHLDVILILVQGQPDKSPWCRVRAKLMLGAGKWWHESMLGRPSVFCSIRKRQHDDILKHQDKFHLVSHADHAPTRDGESIRRQPGPRGRVRNKPTVCSTMVKNNPTTYAVIGMNFN